MQNIRLRSPIRNLNFAADPAPRAKSEILLRDSKGALSGTPPLRFTTAGMTGCAGSRFA